VLTAQLVAFFAVGVYRGTWNHFRRKDRVTFLKGVALGVAASQLAVLGIYGYYSYSISVFLIYATVLGALMILARSIVSGVESYFD
jgi:peptidoglycan/LPS O-acetylase OafA/YrhL